MVNWRNVTLEGNKFTYGNLFNDTEKITMRRFKEILANAGISKIINNDNNLLSINELIFDKITIVVNPKLQSEKISNETSIVEIYGERYVLFPAYKQIEDCLDIKFNDKIIAQYYKERNLVLMYFNPFLIQPRIRKFKSAIDTILILEKPYNDFNNKEFLEKKFLLKNASKFIANLKDRYDSIDNEVISIRNKIETKSKEIIEFHKDIEIKRIFKESVSKMIDNFEQEFEKNILETKKLAFIEDIQITNDGVELDYGHIDIDYRNKKYSIGHMIVVIKPNQVLFKNLDRDKNQNPHPHVYNDNHACLGSFAKDVNELLSGLQFKRLAILLLQFLRSYNPNSPVCQIQNFEQKQSSDNLGIIWPADEWPGLRPGTLISNPSPNTLISNPIPNIDMIRDSFVNPNSRRRRIGYRVTTRR